ncbi:MAG: c-type cytochrome [Anaerolineae bacterium]|nr:c-type cytochrome [Anaerolineae bacterium]
MRILLLAILGLLLLAGIGALLFVFGFFLSARTALDTPSNFQVQVAELGKGTFLIPADYQRRANPVAASPDIFTQARRTYNSRCSVCHGPDGQAKVATGERMFPRAADLTSARAQGKSDGALFWILENGYPHTGMPGWKGLLSDQELWQLVTLIRALPQGMPQAAETPTAVALAPTAVPPTAVPTPAPPTATTAPPTAAPTTAPTTAATSVPATLPPATQPPTAVPPTQPLPTAVPPTAVAAVPKAASEVNIAIDNYAYLPDTVTVPVGAKVTWLNKDDEVHTVTSEAAAPLFDSGEFGKNGTFSFTFSQPGEYAYYCVPHDYMRGKIVVR